jgi:hypothetical protein
MVRPPLNASVSCWWSFSNQAHTFPEKYHNYTRRSERHARAVLKRSYLAPYCSVNQIEIEIEIEIEIVYSNPSINRLMSLCPPC